MWPDNVGHTVGRCRPHSGFMTRGKNATRVHNRYPVSLPFHICSLRGCVRSEGTVFCSSVLCKYFFLFSVLLIRKSLLKILIAIGQLICRMYFRVLHRFGCCSGSMETDKNSTTTSRIMRFDGACSFFFFVVSGRSFSTVVFRRLFANSFVFQHALFGLSSGGLVFISPAGWHSIRSWKLLFCRHARVPAHFDTSRRLFRFQFIRNEIELF